VGEAVTDLTPHEEFYLALGRFMYEWGHLEIVLDLLLLQTSEGKRQADKPLPHQLNVKINLIRVYIRGTDQEAEISAALDGVCADAQTRHDFVHGGVLHHRIDAGEITVTLARLLQPNRAPHRRKPVVITPAEITAAADRVSELADQLDRFLDGG
jgi:hypothetical protein